MDPARSGLIALQFEQDVGDHAKPRRKIHGCRCVLEPVPAGFLAMASFASPERRRIRQTRSRQDPGTGLDPKTLHHFVEMQSMVECRRCHGHPTIGEVMPKGQMLN